jgi:hypothetical protein
MDNTELAAKRFGGIYETLKSANALMGVLLSNGASQTAQDAVVLAAFEVIVEIAEGRHDEFLSEEDNSGDLYL